jgi:hypothetical protein
MKVDWEKVKIKAQVFSWVAIPLIIALSGYFIQTAIKEREIRIRYVELAINILREPRETSKNENDALRSWAIEVLSRYSPIELNEDIKRELTKRPIFIGTGNMVLQPPSASLKGTIGIPPKSKGRPEKPKG